MNPLGLFLQISNGISKDSSVLVLNATTFALEASSMYSSSVVSFGSLNLHPQVTSDTASSLKITAPPQGKNFGGVPVVKSNGENEGPVEVVIPRLAPSVTVNVLSPVTAYVKVLPVVPLASSKCSVYIYVVWKQYRLLVLYHLPTNGDKLVSSCKL